MMARPYVLRASITNSDRFPSMLLYNPSMANRKGNESAVGRDEEDDGSCHNAADEAAGPARSQVGVDMGDEDRAECPCPAARRRQPAHVHTLMKQTRCMILTFRFQNETFEKYMGTFKMILKHHTCLYLPEVWVQGFWNTVCRTSHCRLGIPLQ